MDLNLAHIAVANKRGKMDEIDITIIVLAIIIVVFLMLWICGNKCSGLCLFQSCFYNCLQGEF